MDIEQFYDENVARRASEEIEFGRDWHDESGTRWEISWVAATGELYAMKEPAEAIVMDPVGDEYVPDLPTELVSVEILGVVPTREEVDRVMAGWQDAMGRPGSLEWLRSRVARHGGDEADVSPSQVEDGTIDLPPAST